MLPIAETGTVLGQLPSRKIDPPNTDSNPKPKPNPNPNPNR